MRKTPLICFLEPTTEKIGIKRRYDIYYIASCHVETVALLTRKKDVERIDIEMAVDKEDVTEKATYQKIKEYVKEKVWIECAYEVYCGSKEETWFTYA